MITYDELVKYLKEKDADYSEINQPLYKQGGNVGNSVYDIEIIWGDWKHGWMYLRYLMEQIGYKEISHKVTEEDGSDCWSGVSRFVDKNMYAIFQ